jgi:cytochrome c oxidase cbb3-type subunit 3
MIARVRLGLIGVSVLGLTGALFVFGQTPASPAGTKAGTAPQGQAPAAAPAPGQPTAGAPPGRAPRQNGPYMGLGTVASAQTIAAGKALFESNCSFCHGADARGGRGPDLVQSPVVLDDEGTGKDVGAVVSRGFPPQMPSFNFTPQQISDLAAFLHSRVLAVANLAHGRYSLPFVVSGNAQKGKAFFNGPGKCSTCHSVTGDLAHIGSKYQPIDIQNAILSGRIGQPAFIGRGQAPVRKVTVTMPSGQVLTGDLKYVDEFNVIFVDSAGNVHSLPITKGMKVNVAKPAWAVHQDLLGLYTDADIHNLTAYLVSLK